MARTTTTKKPAPKTVTSLDAADAALRELAQTRIAIEGVSPEIDGGRFPAKAVVGEDYLIEADIFGDGHDVIDAAVEWRHKGDEHWRTAPMRFVDNDRWAASIRFERIGSHEFTILAWRDLFAGWSRDVEKKIAAGQVVDLETIEGVHLVEAAARNAAGTRLEQDLQRLLASLREGDTDAKLAILLAAQTHELMHAAN